MTLYHEARIPSDAISIVISSVKAGDYKSVEAVDALTESLGCLNALRGPTVMGATGDCPELDGLTTEQKCDKAEELTRELTAPQAGKANPLEGIDLAKVMQLVAIIKQIADLFFAK